MQKSVRTSMAVFMLCLFPFTAIASSLTSKDLLEGCVAEIKTNESKSTNVNAVEEFKAGACMGYIKGFDDMEIIYASLIASPSTNEADIKKYSLYCLPAGTGNVAIAKVFVSYLKKHPELMNEDGGLSLTKSLREAFPCPTQAKPK